MPTRPTPGGDSFDPDEVPDSVGAQEADEEEGQAPDGDERYPLWQRLIDAVLQAWP